MGKKPNTLLRNRTNVIRKMKKPTELSLQEQKVEGCRSRPSRLRVDCLMCGILFALSKMSAPKCMSITARPSCRYLSLAHDFNLHVK